MGLPLISSRDLSVPMRRLSPPARMMPVMIKITVFTMRCQQGSGVRDGKVVNIYYMHSTRTSISMPIWKHGILIRLLIVPCVSISICYHREHTCPRNDFSI
jgi:hypothetical protein